jgi:hypothetical protein
MFLEILQENIIFTLTTFAGTFIALLLGWCVIERRILKVQSRTAKTHMVNLAIKDLTLNLYFTSELLHNEVIQATGTYARYWFDGIKQVNLSSLTGSKNGYVQITSLIHILDVDNRKLEDGLFSSVIENASFIQKQLLAWIPLLNAIIEVHNLKIPLLPPPEEMAKQVEKEQECRRNQ